MELLNKNIIITGASTGIGNALVKEFANYNCNLFLLARRIELLEELKNSLKNKPANIYCFKNDVGDKTSVVEAYKQIIAIAKKIDIAILNSGVGYRMTIEEYDSTLALKTFNTNFMGLVYWIEQLLPGFMNQKSGIIAGVSSLADSRGFSGSGFYCASKAAASIYLEGMRVELNKYGIKVITIKPGFVKTPMTDVNEFKMPFLMPADKAARIIIKGLLKGKRIIQFPLPTVIGTKIIGLLPNFLYDFLSNKQNKN
ncbi:MAG TPA: SDR family NAD(P)-dependent oxidoreductase [Melioribacteraceae bacterium]|nr:SDR family NAD(P)-dependent oxidoreductase [Melioribacteraceae bacterium]